MSKVEYSPGALFGDRPMNLSRVFIAEQDGSIAAQLRAEGYYAGVLAAKSVLEEFYADNPGQLEQIERLFTGEFDG